ncbi:LysM peptidoglycan-binding domain-containing protein [Streptomyces sp. NPDC058701]|uniref:LysM peptidoglycan-binding domain-containing protein n=1 Tax=Streptomyces sp. NPDC058701 TaxID=3346608 RepID=UPI00364D707D
MTKPSPTHPSLRPARGGVQTAAAVIRGLLSLTVLAALLFGLPILLWWATSIVGPPGLAALGSLFSTDDSGQVFLLALAAAGWIGWAGFAFAVLLEIPAQLRGRSAPQIRGLLGQRAAASLVGTVLLALPTGTALAAPASAAPSLAVPAGVSAAAVPGTAAAGHATTGSSAAAEGASAAPAYTVRDVRPAESLWSIAEQSLGDGQRWEEIATLNQGRTMADGTIFDAEQPIQPGWILTLPTDAATAGAPGPQAQGAVSGPVAGQGGEYSVREGDNLSSIAAAQLGQPDRYTDIFDLNRGKPVPGGGTFTDPDLIYPGQQLTLPAASAPAQEPGSAAPGTTRPTPAPEKAEGETVAPAPVATSPVQPREQASPSPAPGTPTSAPAPAASSPAAQQPRPTASAAPTPATTAAPSTEQSTAPAAPTLQSRSTGINWGLVGGIGTLLAAALAGTLAVRRILQQRQRRAGQTIAQDDTPTTTEQTLAATSQPAGVELLDTVLRTLAHQAAENGETLPALRGARLTEPDDVTLLLDEPAEPIAPFTTGPDTRTWVLDRTATPTAADEAADVQAPYPGLVTIGADERGLLLADLTTCRMLLLDGTDEEVLEVARALALELGTCGWTDYSEILTEGLGTRLAGLLPQGRIRTMPHLPAVAADLGELLLEAHQTGEQVLPWLLIAAGDHAEGDVIQLADALSAARDLQTAVVLPATAHTRRTFPHAEILDTTRDQQALLAPLETPVTLQRVSDAQYRDYVHALQVSLQEPEPATGAWGFAEDHGQAAATGKPLTVRVTSADADAAQDPGNPFPALLAGITPTQAAPPATVPTTAAAPSADAQAADGAGPLDTGQKTASRPAEPGALPQQTAHTPAETDSAPQAKPASDGEPFPGVRIDMLGPLRITGSSGSTHAHTPRTTALAALLHLRPGRTGDYLCHAMDPVKPWSTRTLHSRLSELRNEIGHAEDGKPLLPRPKADTGSGYAFHRAVTSDWDAFKRLASRGLAAGPQDGIADLESAMALVRGKPFDGRILPWAEPVIQEMLSRITDTAHTLARWHTDGEAPDLDAARRAVLHALEVEETSEVLYRDLLNIEWAADNLAAIRRTVARLQQMARTYDITLDGLTEDTIQLVLSGRPTSTRAR